MLKNIEIEGDDSFYQNGYRKDKVTCKAVTLCLVTDLILTPLCFIFVPAIMLVDCSFASVSSSSTYSQRYFLALLADLLNDAGNGTHMGHLGFTDF